ncbi:hypothetical protein QQ045_030986 [Rhodiola kirilowii]
MKSTGGRNSRRIFGPPQGRSARDEDLVLFRELHKREKDRIASLLLPVSDEFELTGANYYTHNPALFRIPSNKKSSSGLESLSGSDKNDYDWLKTPPATPLFPSLEMEAATAPEMAVQRELPIMQPLSRFSSNFLQGPRLEADPSPKTPTITHKPKPSPTPVVTSTTSKPNNKPSIHHSMPRHPDPFLTSNLSKPDPKPKPESASRPKSRGSVSPLVRAKIKGVSDHTPANLKIDNRSLSSTRGRVASGRAVGLTPNVKPADPRPLSVTRSRTAVSGGGAAATTPFVASDQRRQSRSPSVRRTEGMVKERREDGGGGMATQSFFGSKMVDKVMSARKKGGGDAAAKTAERLERRGSAPGGSGGLGRVVATKSSLDMAAEPTMETKGALSRRSKMVTRAK